MSVIYKEPKTRAEIETEADEIAKIRIKIRKLTVARDAVILKINEQYNPQIKALEAERDCRENALAPFVSARKEELMGKNKSASSPLSMYGFRTGQVVVRNITGKSDDAVTYELFEAARADCAKAKYSLDKRGIQKALKNGDAHIEELFEMEVVERFYVEPKTDKDIGE